jgi:hypothetical protein
MNKGEYKKVGSLVIIFLMAVSSLSSLAFASLNPLNPYGFIFNFLDLNQLVTASYSCSDALSGVASNSGTVPSGSYIDAGTVGSKTFTVTGTDKAGNTVTQTLTYNVIYKFGGFLPPLESGKTYKAGRTIPVKFKLTDANGKYISTAKALIYVDGKDGASSDSSNVGNAFGYDSQYIFNLSTKDLSTGDHTIVVKLDDGTAYSIKITLK